MRTPLLRQGRLRAWALPTLAAAVLVTALVSVMVGRYGVAPGELAGAVQARLAGGFYTDTTVDSVVFNLRLPRITVAILVGAGMSVAGAAFQSLFSNPLATPDTLGVASGTCVGAVIALLADAGMIGVQLTALAAGLITVTITTTVARRRGAAPDVVMLVLAGVIVSALADAVLSMLKITADPTSDLPEITYWLMGSLAGTSWRQIALAAPFIVGGCAIVLALRWRLNVLALSEDEARSAGVDVRTLRLVLIVAATVITASVVSMCGQVGWIGLIVPHAARMLVGSNNRQLIPVSLLLGSSVMVVIDTVARTLTASEIPVSVITAIVGAPFFITLLRRTAGGRA